MLWLVLGILLKTTMKGETTELLLDVPPYRVPFLRALKSQPIQRSRAAHFKAEAEKLSSATHSSRQAATYQSVSPIFGNEPR